jgi:hypothetical protein
MSTPRDRVGDLVGRYCDAVLRADTAAFADLWTSDGQWLIAGRPPIAGPAAIAELFERTRSKYRLCVQEILSGVVDPAPASPDQSRWAARWQVRELQWGGGESGDDGAQQLIGVYHDLVADDGGPHLRFAQRRFEVLYRGPIDLSGRLYTAPPLTPEAAPGG